MTDNAPVVTMPYANADLSQFISFVRYISLSLLHTHIYNYRNYCQLPHNT